MIRRLVTAYTVWQERSRARAMHFHAGPRGALSLRRPASCDKWADQRQRRRPHRVRVAPKLRRRR